MLLQTFCQLASTALYVPFYYISNLSCLQVNGLMDMYIVLNCHNVARHIEFSLGWLRFNMTSTRNAGCFKESFTTLKGSIKLFRGHVQCSELS
jgi:hypothetical protein